ncbi:MAG: hypothetical protein H0T68_00115 [Gemmatimonadales bacterium]|nr:hypothetical protein [Gemmatimonadales bacterium]
MTLSVPAVALALCLALIVRAAAAAPFAPDSSGLQFHGFRAGAALDELDAHVRRLEGGTLRCDRAKADRRVTECHGRFSHPALGGPVDLWISAIDSMAGIITISRALDSDQLDRWRDGIVASYGRVGARAQGSQWMMQWVRRGRMLRLTWRTERGAKVASVSLVDGRVLDAWGRSRSRRSLVVGDSVRH